MCPQQANTQLVSEKEALSHAHAELSKELETQRRESEQHSSAKYKKEIDMLRDQLEEQQKESER